MHIWRRAEVCAGPEGARRWAGRTGIPDAGGPANLGIAPSCGCDYLHY